MGISLCIYIKRNQLQDLLEDTFAMGFLLQFSFWRYYTFLDEMGIEEDVKKLNSKDILMYLALQTDFDPTKIIYKENWARIASEYDLLLAPDTEKVNSDKWIDVYGIYTAMVSMVTENSKTLDNLLDTYYRFESIKNGEVGDENGESEELS